MSPVRMFFPIFVCLPCSRKLSVKHKNPLYLKQKTEI